MQLSDIITLTCEQLIMRHLNHVKSLPSQMFFTNNNVRNPPTTNMQFKKSNYIWETTSKTDDGLMGDVKVYIPTSTYTAKTQNIAIFTTMRTFKSHLSYHLCSCYMILLKVIQQAKLLSAQNKINRQIPPWISLKKYCKRKLYLNYYAYNRRVINYQAIKLFSYEQSFYIILPLSHIYKQIFPH